MWQKLIILILAGLAGFVLGLWPGIDDVFVRHTHYSDLSIERFGYARGAALVVGMFLPFAFVVAVISVLIANAVYDSRSQRNKDDAPPSDADDE